MDPFFQHLLPAFEKAVVGLPAAEVMILVVVLALCLVFRGNRIGLMVAFVCAYRWGWQFLHASYGEPQYQHYVSVYKWFGIVVAVLTTIELAYEFLIRRRRGAGPA